MRIKWKTLIRCVFAVIVAITVLYPTSTPASAAEQTFKNAYTRLYIGGYYAVRPVFQTWEPHKWHVRKWKDGTVELSHTTWGAQRYALDDSAHGFRTYPRNFT